MVGTACHRHNFVTRVLSAFTKHPFLEISCYDDVMQFFLSHIELFKFNTLENEKNSSTIEFAKYVFEHPKNRI